MRFVVVHKATSFLMVLTSLLALAASGELNPIIPGAALALLGVSWFWEPPRVDPARFDLPWNILTVLMLGKTVLDVITGASLLIAGVHFIIFLAVNKAFNRRSSRDYMQLYVVSFLQMVAATALNNDLTYGVLFLAYIVFSTWTLILFHLKREMEENYLLKYGDSLQGRPVQVQRVLNSRKLVGGRFLLATSVVSLFVFAGAVTFFFLFPRVGFGYFFKKTRPGIAMVGFSERLELGHFGLIKDNPTVVMRVEFSDPGQRALAEPYWRGITFDYYDGQTWAKSRANTKRLLAPHDGSYALLADRPFAGPPIEQAIYLEPMETRVLFGLSRMRQVRLDLPGGKQAPRLRKHRGIQTDDEGDVHYEQTDEIAFRYFVTSEPPRVDPTLLRGSMAAYRDATQRRARGHVSRYLQLPDALAPRINGLGRDIVGDARTVGEAIDRVERHLRTQYAYTLDLGRDDRFPPLEDFLFVQRKGHCEYFATAMVILLRTQGIAARTVNGFYGGSWNSYGGYLAVSQGDAHSWVEVLLPEERCTEDGVCRWQDHWITRDATPAGGTHAASGGLMGSLEQYADALRMRWYRYVIEYDLEQQLGFLSDLRQLWRGAFGEAQTDRAGGARGAIDRRWLGAVAASLLALALAILGWRRARGGGRAPLTSPERRAATVATLFADMARTYAALGFTRGPTTTAREYLALLRGRAAPQLDVAEAVVALYEAVRFGGADLDHGDATRLARAVRRIGRAPDPA